MKLPKWLPKEINIKGEVYQIQVGDRIVTKDDDDPQGICRTDMKVIALKKQKKVDMLRTFLHELGHAVLFETSTSDLLSDDLEEIIVDNIAGVFLPYMKKR